MKNNVYIEMLVSEFRRSRQMEVLYLILEVLMKRMDEEGEAPMPMLITEGHFPNVTNLKVNETFHLEENVKLKFDLMLDSDKNQWVPLFTSYDEINKGETSNITFNVPIERILRVAAFEEDVEGVVINPFVENLSIPKHMLKIMFDQYKEGTNED